MNKSDAIALLIGFAQGQVGYQEGANNYNKYAEDSNLTKLYGWNVQNQPWCDVFVDEAFIQCFGYEDAKALTYQFDGCSGAACRFSANYYQNHGAYYQYPEVGDQIFFIYDGAINHTGIVVSIDGNQVITVEGNSSDSVRRNSYAKTNPIIAGYGRPNWSVLADVDDPVDKPQEKPQEETAPEVNILYMTTRMPIIKPNMAKIPLECVRTLQIILNGKGENLTVDSLYGWKTQTATENWQKNHSLEPDKEVGALTWRSLLTEK